MPPSYGVGSALALILTVILLIITIGYVRVSVQLVDLPPFEAAIKAGTLAIMPSHLRVPELTGDLPATVSGAALTGLLRGELGNRDEYNLGVYVYDRAFTMPPSYGIGSALALILTVILLIITIGYVRASVRQGAIQ